MKLVRSLAVALGVAMVVSVVACSSDTSSSGSNCQSAKAVADSCNKQPQEAGTSLTINFDADKCEGSDPGKKIADCIVANKSRCDCIVRCSLSGGTC